MMGNGPIVAMAKAVDRSLRIHSHDPGPRELENLRRDVAQLVGVLQQRLAIAEGVTLDRAKSRLPYRDD